MDNSTPIVVKIHDVNIDKDYIGWIEELKSRYRRAQIKAAVKVNAEKLLFNWELGRDLVIRKAEERWGAGVVEQLSLDLLAAFPESKGFGARNLWYMKDWFSFYSPHTEKLHQLDAEFQNSINQVDIKLHQAGAEFPLILALIPWKHHTEIISKCETIDEATFYIKKTISENWSRTVLQRCL